MAALAGVSRAAPPMAGRCGCSWAWRTRQGLDIHGRLLSLAASPAFPPVAPLRPCAPARPHGNPPRPSSPTGTEAPEYQCASLLPSTSALLPSPASVPSYKDAGRLFRCLRRAKGRPPRRCFLLAPRASSSATSPDESAHDGSAEGGNVSGHRNRFLDLARLGAVVEGAAEAFFGSEIRRRLAITAVLIMLSRVGYFAPLPTVLHLRAY